MSENTPEICVRCNKSVKTGLKCIKCGKLSHSCCLKLMKSAKFMPDGTVICCAANDGTVDVEPKKLVPNEKLLDVSAATDKIKIKYLEELLKQKDVTIKKQEELSDQKDHTIKSLETALTALNQQIDLLKQSRVNTCANKADNLNFANALKLTNNIPSTATNPSHSSGNNPQNPPKNQINTKITPLAVSSAVHMANANTVCNEIIKLNNPNSENQPGYRRRRTNLLIGSNDDTNTCPFKAAAPRTVKEFDATNFEPDVDIEELEKYIKSFASSATVEKLDCRFPAVYASFKITVAFEEADKILVSEMWPSKVY
ncbi:unnamed protein product [Psylliodes chrysocephalus]|uniref:Phorbol-ester/DAG-type domain-containing protein n=1 Tax=Psylliodes chrysocephalus TaxID=3402493 RepID=A0A9P0CDP8_9CUCU|nr:unnamed protein product [Psylliodes chrysocephala]